MELHLEYHELANLFPLIDGDEFESLVTDISENGQHEPIWLYEGKILDGRNRYRACMEVDIEPITKQYDGDDALGFVLSLNLHRRHLTASQRAVLALDVLPFLEAEAKERQREYHGNQHDNEGGLRELIPQVQNDEPKPERDKKSTEKAAEIIKVNPRYIQDAKKIKNEAPQVLEAIKDGTVNIQSAKQISKLDDTEQSNAIEQIKNGVSPKKAIDNARYTVANDMRPDEVDRMNQAKNGVVVVANQSADKALIKWAIDNGRYVKIDRGTDWGNPFILNKDGDRDTVCNSYGVYLRLKPSLLKNLDSLHGKVLGCHCYPENCHGNVIAGVANNVD